MKNVDSAKISIEAEIILLESRLKTCQQIKEGLNSLYNETIETTLNQTNSTTGNPPTIVKMDLTKLQDYPFEKRLFEKLKYLDEKFPKAWKMKDRLEMMVQIEGEASKIKFKSLSQDLKYLVKTGLYIGAKYNSDNKTQFYFRAEWLNVVDGKRFIKPEYAPNPEDFGTMQEHKRNPELIFWVTGEK